MKLTLNEAIEREKEIAERNRKDLDEAIKDSKKYSKDTNSIIEFEKAKAFEDIIDGCTRCAEKHEQLAEWLEELKQYKDAEEQELLLRLPCKPGDVVYAIEHGKIHTIIASDEIYLRQGELNIECGNGHYIGMYSCSDLNKSLFLTKEAAEQALKNMEDATEEKVERKEYEQCANCKRLYTKAPRKCEECGTELLFLTTFGYCRTGKCNSVIVEKHYVNEK